MAINLRNHGFVEGRLAADPVHFINADGSKKVFVTLYADRNYRNTNGERDSDRISLETFVAATTPGLGVFNRMHKGDLVELAYTVRSEEYPHPSTGEIVYKQYLRIEVVDLKESLAVVNQRLAQRLSTTQRAPEAAAAPEPTEEVQPAPKTRQHRQKVAQPA